MENSLQAFSLFLKLKLLFVYDLNNIILKFTGKIYLWKIEANWSIKVINGCDNDMDVSP